MQQLRNWQPYHDAHHVLIYLAVGDEIIVKDLHENAKALYTTRTWGRKKELTIHPLEARLEQHRLGYWQPPTGAQKGPADQIELALVPGCCFDITGTRIGCGAAYYDRPLPFLLPKIPRVGVTLETLIVTALPTLCAVSLSSEFPATFDTAGTPSVLGTICASASWVG